MEMTSETTQNSALRTDEAASHGPLWRLIDCAVTAHANRAKVPVNRKRKYNDKNQSSTSAQEAPGSARLAVSLGARWGKGEQ